MLILALLEGSVIFATTSGLLLVWRGRPGGWFDLAAVATAAALSVCITLGLAASGLYNLRTVRSFGALLRRVVLAFTAVALLAVAFAALVPAARLVASPLKSGLLITVAVIFGPMLPLRAVAYRLMRTRRFVRRLLIVGTSLLAWQLIEEIQARPDCRYAVAGVTDDERDTGLVRTQDTPGSLAGLDAVIDGVQPDEIVVTLPYQRGQLPVQELLDARVHRGIPVHDGVALFERLAGKLPIEALASSHLIFSGGFRQSRLSLWVRRCVSVVSAALGLVATAPLLGLIALAIRLDSPGPVLFTQLRVGFRGRPFTLLKFRTMRPVDHPPSEWERDNGHRITRVGRWLRRLWLDELPQLVNVLRGDMDLVGPRPHPVCNADLFAQKIPYYRLRTAVRPGLTGWAQVRYGYANDVDEEVEKMCYDLYYIKHRSLWLDLRVLLQTVKMILSSRDVDAEDRVVDVGRIAVFPGSAPLAGRAGSPDAAFASGELELQLTHEPTPH